MARRQSLLVGVLVLLGSLSGLADDDRKGLPLPAAAITPFDGDVPAVLHWSSGDSLPGQLVGVANDVLTWKSPLFDTPLQLRRSALSFIQFRPQDVNTSPADDFRIALHNGDVIFGHLDQVDEATATVTSSRFGTIRIPREEIGGIERINHKGGLIYIGPSGVDGWSGPDVRERWRDFPDGSIRSDVTDASLFRTFDHRGRVAVEFVLDFQQMPDFVLSVGDADNCVRLETWEDTLVVVAGNDFLEVRTMPDGHSSLHLLLYVDIIRHRIVVATPSGDTLIDSDELSLKQLAGRIELRKGQGTLTLEHLRISNWNGTTSGSLSDGRTGLQQLKGDIRYGAVESVRDGTLYLKSDGGVAEVPLQTVGSLELNSATTEDHPNSSPSADSSRIRWRDGGILTGHLVRQDAATAVLRPEWSNTDITTQVQGLQLIRFQSSQSQPAGQDELIVDGRLLHGCLVVDSGDRPVTWKPTGGIQGVELRSGDNAVVMRQGEAIAVSINPDEFPDTLYLRNNDVIPCRVDRITEDAIRLTSPFGSAREFQAKSIKAIEFSSTRAQVVSGFQHDDWKQIRGRSIKTDGVVQLRSGSIGNDQGMISDRLSFHAKWPPTQWTVLTVRLFADDLAKPSTATACTLILANGTVALADHLQPENPFLAMQQQDRRISVPKNSADITLRMVGGAVEIQINGTRAGEVPLNTDGAAETGVIIELSRSHDMRTNPGLVVLNGRAQRAPPANDKAKLLTLSALESGTPAGRSVQQFINEESRRHALTIPRFRRDAPPTHVLIAPNGDVLRGRLLGVTETHVQFESRLQAFHFERSRVAAVVWIENPRKPNVNGAPPEAVAGIDPGILQTVLSGGLMVSMTPTSLQDGQLHGLSPVLGDCLVPAASITRLYLGAPEQRQDTAAYSEWEARYADEPDWDSFSDDDGHEAAMALLGHEAPGFELPQLDGTSFKLSDHQDKVVVLDFWASWCGPCVAALPGYIEATKAFGESELVFAAVNIEESPQRIRRFLEEKEWDVRVAVDHGGIISGQYLVNSIPHTVVISPEGIVEHVKIGYDPDGGQEISRIAKAMLTGSWQRPER